MVGIDSRFVRDISLRQPLDDRRYPFTIPAVRHLGVLELHPQVTYLVGENGSGKSTIMEALAIALGFNGEGGTRNTQFKTLASESDLSEYLEVSRGSAQLGHGFFFRAETMHALFSAAQRESEDPFGWHVYGWQNRHQASHGESHLGLFREKMRSGLYLLDEPEAALSPEKQLAFLAIMKDLLGCGSQLVICTHSPIILSYPEAWIYSLDDEDDGTCRSVASQALGPRRIAYEQAGCVVFSELFYRHRQRMLREVLRDDSDEL